MTASHGASMSVALSSDINVTQIIAVLLVLVMAMNVTPGAGVSG